MVHLLYDLGFAKVRLAHSPRLHGRPLDLLGAFSHAFSSRCATERPAWQEGSRPANVLVRWVVQARDDPTQADLILAMVCSERLVARRCRAKGAEQGLMAARSMRQKMARNALSIRYALHRTDSGGVKRTSVSAGQSGGGPGEDLHLRPHPET